MVFLYHPLYDRNIKRKDVFHYEKILLAFGLHCFLYSNFTRDTHCRLNQKKFCIPEKYFLDKYIKKLYMEATTKSGRGDFK